MTIKHPVNPQCQHLGFAFILTLAPYISNQAGNISEGKTGFQRVEKRTLFRYVEDFYICFYFLNPIIKADFLWLQLKDHSVVM